MKSVCVLFQLGEYFCSSVGVLQGAPEQNGENASELTWLLLSDLSLKFTTTSQLMVPPESQGVNQQVSN